MVLALILAICTGLLARHKGYSFFCWVFIGGFIGIIIVACLPDSVEPKTPMEPHKVDRLRKQINWLGAILSLLVIATGFLIRINGTIAG
jgi:dipeptide/tripeptide permease